MSLADCVKLKKQLDPADLEHFDIEFKMLVDGGVPAEAAYSEAAQAVLETMVAERNDLATEIREKGGYLEDITLENLLNPASLRKDEAAPEDRPSGDFMRRAPAVSELGFYSAVEKAVLDMNLPAWKQEDGAAKGKEIWAKLKTMPVKKEELEWLGIEDWLMVDPEQKFTRNRVTQFIANNGVQLEESQGTIEGAYPEPIDWGEPVAMENPPEEGVEPIYIVEPQNTGFFSDDSEVHGLRITGNNDIGWMVTSADEVVVVGTHSSLNEAQIQAGIWMQENDLHSSGEDAAQYEDYVMGGNYRNYREVKLKIPEIDYTDVHFASDPGMIAWMRVTERDLPTKVNENIPEGSMFRTEDQNTYFIEELQSGLHQEGRQKGYRTGLDIPAAERESSRQVGKLMSRVGDFWDVLAGKYETRRTAAGTELIKVPATRLRESFEMTFFEVQQLVMNGVANDYFSQPPPGSRRNFIGKELRLIDFDFEGFKSEIERANALRAKLKKETEALPDAPFKNDAHINLVVKRALTDAAQLDNDALAWTNAAEQTDRWSDQYAKLYKTQYDQKMVSIVKKLTGQTPQMVDMNGQPLMSEQEYLEKHIVRPAGDPTGPVSGWVVSPKIEGFTEDGRAFAPPITRDTWGSREDAENYLKERAQAQRSEPGYWTVPLTEELKEKIRGEGLPLFKRRKGQTKKQTTVTQLHEWLDPYIEKLAPWVEVELVQRGQDIDPMISGRVAGYHHQGKAWVVAAGNKSREQAIESLTHEVIGHLGLDVLLGPDGFTELVDEVRRLKAAGNKTINDIVENQLKPAYTIDGEYQLQSRQEAREILAFIAQSKPRIGPLRQLIQNIWNRIKMWFADHGLAPLVDRDVTNIESYILRATQLVQTDFPGHSVVKGELKKTAPKGDFMRRASEEGLRVAARTPDGRVLAGYKGHLHFNLPDLYPWAFADPDAPLPELGFVTPAGKFLTRKEALQHVKDQRPDFKERGIPGQLEAEDYNLVRPTGDFARRPPEEEDLELLRKLGLEDKKADSLLKRINDMAFGWLLEEGETLTGRSYEGLFDGQIEAKRAEKRAGKGIDAGDYAGSGYVGMRMAAGVGDIMTHVLKYGAVEWRGGVPQMIDGTRGFFDMLADLGDHVNDWLVWMAGHRAEKLMELDKEANLNADDIARAKSKNIGNEELFERIKNEYMHLNEAMLDFQEGAGLINPKERAKWESDWYVPFFRQLDDEGSIMAPRTKQGFSHQTSSIRRLMGAELPTGDLLENILTNWMKAIDASMKNSALDKLLHNLEGTDMISDVSMQFKPVLITKAEIIKRIKADRNFAVQVAEHYGMKETARNLDIINKLRKDDTKGFQQMFALSVPTDPDVVRVKRGGKSKYYRMHVPGLLRSIGHMNQGYWGSNSGAMKSFRWFKRLLTKGVTASPDFMFRNFIRDAAHAWVINEDSFSFAGDSLRGLKEAMKEGDLHRAMMAGGASFQGGYVHATDPEGSAEILRRKLEEHGYTRAQIKAHEASLLNTPAKLKDVLVQNWQWYREQGDKIENANRVATLKASLDAGKPLAQALFESRDLMDYNRRGNYALLMALTDMMPFLNARLQGFDKANRATWKNPKLVGLRIAKIAAFSIALAALNDDEERYQALPDWDKDANWHFFFGDQHWRIPKPFELGIIGGTFPERIYHTWVTGSQPNAKLLWSMQHALFETMHINIYPQAILPVVEVSRNRSLYFDTPIETMAEKRLESHRRFNSYTSATAIELGDTALAKWIGVSPKQMQHMWEGYTGTLGAYALGATDVVTRWAADHPRQPDWQLSDKPLIKTVYRGDKKRTTQYSTDFYDRLEEVETLYATFKDYYTSGERETAMTYREENMPKLRYRKRLLKVQQNLTKLRKKRDAIVKDRDLSPEEKYEQTQAIQARINDLVAQTESQTREAFTE